MRYNKRIYLYKLHIILFYNLTQHKNNKINSVTDGKRFYCTKA